MLPITQGLLADALDCIRRGTQGQPFASRAELARASKVSDANLSRWISGTATPTLKKLESVLAALGVSLVLPDGLKPAGRSSACLTYMQDSEFAHGYCHIPVLGQVGTGDAACPQRQSLLAPANFAKASMVAVHIALEERSMLPRLQPGDTVLVDRDIPAGQYDNSIYLVQTPPSEGSKYMLQRVTFTKLHNRPAVLFFSDNSSEGYAPLCFEIALYPEASLHYAILGKVVYRMGNV